MEREFLKRIMNGRIKLLLLFLISTMFVQGQTTRDISGTIRDSFGDPMIGVNVVVKNDATLGTISNVDGKYFLNIPRQKVTLVFSFIGYKTVEKTIDANLLKLDVELIEDTELLDEVVVVGYGTMKKKDVTGSVSHIGKEIMETKVATNAVDFLKGNIAGVNISVSNSPAGGGTIQVRGPSSFSNTSPLIVLDGVIFYGAIGDINPNDIDRIDVLKDASSTAVYGTKGSAGVVLITTKKGKSEKPQVNFSVKLGLTQVGIIAPMPTPEQYIQRRADYFKTIDYFEADKNKKGLGYYDNPNNLPSGVTQEQWAGYDPSFSGDYVDTWLNRLNFASEEIKNYKAGRTIDWRDQVYRTGLRQEYNVSLSGNVGHINKTNYYLSLGYTNNEGHVVGDDYQTLRGRVNIDSDVNKWLKIGINTQFSNIKDTHVAAENADSQSPFGTMYEEDGTLKMFPIDDSSYKNPLALFTYQEKLKSTQTLNANLFAQIKLPYGISFQTTWSNRYQWQQDYLYSPDILPSVVKGGEANRVEYKEYEWMVDNMLKWNYTFNDIHSIDATFVYSVEKYQHWTTDATARELVPNGVLGFHQLSAGLTPVVSSDDQVQTGNALLGRINYSLMDKYLLTASVRRDGFSAFGTDNPYAVFPAFALAWRLSEERFMQKCNFLDNLKVRLSWGETGNRSAAGRYDALAKLSITQVVLNGQSMRGLWTSYLSNKKLKWEKTQAYNLGIDFGLFNNRLSGVIDLYTTKTNDLILSRSMPNVSGFSATKANLGQVNNKGFELTLNSLNMRIPKKMEWSSTFIYSINNNEIAHLYGDMVDITDKDGNVIGQKESDDVKNGWYIGHSLYGIHDYKVTGIWQLGEEEEAKKYGKLPGDPKVLDVDNNGKLGEEDKVWIGSKRPIYTMSLRNDFYLFSCLNISFVFRGEFNFWAANNLPLNNSSRNYDRANYRWTEYWTPDNPTNDYARLGANASDPSINIYKKRDYIRLQNAAISYTVPKRFIGKYGVDNLKFTFNMDNAFVLTKWNYTDPENAAISPRVFTFGVNVTL